MPTNNSPTTAQLAQSILDASMLPAQDRIKLGVATQLLQLTDPHRRQNSPSWMNFALLAGLAAGIMLATQAPSMAQGQPTQNQPAPATAPIKIKPMTQEELDKLPAVKSTTIKPIYRPGEVEIVDSSSSALKPMSPEAMAKAPVFKAPKLQPLIPADTMEMGH
jgi:hypothetical protein